MAPQETASFNQFRKPVGLFLAGGGALGAWEAGFLDVLAKRGFLFDKVLGFSAGALAAARYAFGWRSEVLDRWRNLDAARILRWAPRLRPLSLFSDVSIWQTIEYVGASYAGDEERAKAELRCELITVSLCIDDGTPVYSHFTPRGEKGWDGPIAARIAASCAIPLIFPPVLVAENGKVRTYIDGGVPGREWMRADALSGCGDVIILEMIRPNEIGRSNWLPWRRYEQKGREIVRRQVDSAAASLLDLPGGPRIFRVYPSERLNFSMLNFRSRHCGPAVDLGIADAKNFVQNPSRFLIGSPIATARKLP